MSGRRGSRPRDRSRSSHGSMKDGSSNRFSLLGNNKTEHEFIRSSAAPVSVGTSNIITKASKPPPITVFDVNIVNLKNKLSQIKNIDLSKIFIKLTQHGTKINVHTNDEFNIVRKFCIDNEINFFTHTLKEERNLKICLYGLWNMSTDELENELNSLGINPREIKIINLKNKRYSDQVIYLLYFWKMDNIRISNLRQTKAVFNCIVK